MNFTRTIAAKGTALPKSERGASVVTAEKGMEPAKGVASQVTAWVWANPGTAACLTVGAAVGVPLIVAPMAAAAPVLGAAGFGSGGIVGGSAAAGAMGSSVAAGGAFATLQSAAMGGYGVAAVSGAVQGAGAVIAGASGSLASWLQRKKTMEEGKTVEEEEAHADGTEDEAGKSKL